MNIIKSIIARVEESRLTNKNPSKSYATEEAAEKATAKMAADCALYFAPSNQVKENIQPAHYVVVFVPSWGRWVGGINMSEVLRRKDYGGGYMGICSGFWNW